MRKDYGGDGIMTKNINSSMKITVGLGSIDDYPDFVRAGADEVFCGYIPDVWMKQEGTDQPMNRREVRYVNVQAGSWSEMEILADMRNTLGVPVTVTMNSPCYDPDGYPVIMETMVRCADIGFDSFIVADPGLIGYLNRNLSPFDRTRIHLHLSGETGEINRYVIADARKAGISRIIFQRKCSLSDMEVMIRNRPEKSICDTGRISRFPGISGKNEADSKNTTMEFEAFLLNEMCEFSGCYCNTLHCDEFAPACRIPYRMENGNIGRKEHLTVEDGFEGTVKGMRNPEEKRNPEGMRNPEEKRNPEEIQNSEELQDPEDNVIGAGGCGLCALWELRDIGVNVLKIVSRGNYTENTIRDIRAVKRALEILKDASNEPEYIRQMKRELFPTGCGGSCYYRQSKKE